MKPQPGLSKQISKDSLNDVPVSVIVFGFHVPAIAIKLSAFMRATSSVAAIKHSVVVCRDYDGHNADNLLVFSMYLRTS
jgi:hypothetical protein